MSAALTIAIYAAVIATAGLAWQVLSWRQARKTVLKVTGSLGTVFGVDKPGAKLLLTVRSSEHTPPVYIDQWGFMIVGTKYLVGPAWTHGPDTPHRLEPGQRVTWLMDATEGRASLASNHPNPNHVWHVRPWIRLQSGDERYGTHEHFRTRTMRMWELGFVGSEGRRSFWWWLLRRRDPVLRWTGTTWEKTDRKA
jgi:hypothetical protein